MGDHSDKKMNMDLHRTVTSQKAGNHDIVEE